MCAAIYYCEEYLVLQVIYISNGTKNDIVHRADIFSRK
jgi:hypothetical protein